VDNFIVRRRHIPLYLGHMQIEEHPHGHTRILLAVIVILGVISAGSIAKYVALKSDSTVNARVLTEYRYNDKVLEFMKTFIVKVLKAENEVSFEDRVTLENQVRDLKDQEITSTWNSFVKAQTELQAQDAVKKLLRLLVEKVRVY